MKNTRSIKILCAMVVMVLLTTCVIGTTLARYVTSDSASDTARVAKWGIELQVGGTLFGSDYAANTETNSDSIIAATTSQSVSAFDGAKIVAPGTKNDTGFGFSIKGTPEVKYNVTATTSGNEDIYLNKGAYGVMVKVIKLNAASDVTNYYTLDGTTYTKVAAGSVWDKDTTYYELHDVCEVTTAAYYPLTWTFESANITATFPTKDINKIATSLAETVSTLDGNANAVSDKDFTLTWAWAFNENVAANAADTILGNLIAGMTNVVVFDSTYDNYRAITVDTVNNVAYDHNGDIVANLEVIFNFEVRAEQVD